MFANVDFAKISSSKIKTNRSVGAAYISGIEDVLWIYSFFLKLALFEIKKIQANFEV